MRTSPKRAARPASLAFLCLLVASPLATGGSDQPASDPATMAMASVVGQAVARDAARIFGEDSAQYCVVTDALALCIHPDTPPEQVEEILRRLPTWSGDKYSLNARWTNTAVNGTTGGNSPITLTYSFLDDGVYIPGGAGEAGSTSRLYAELNGHFGSEAVWKAMFAGMFNDWGKHIGVSYQEVADDGADFPSAGGVLGSRGDVRIGAHNIDGTNGTLAYNFFPNVGDMVLDTSEYWSAATGNFVFMRNICRHEHGHGIGLNHVVPENCQKLMEAYICTGFDGPQDDDIRGGMRFYGDAFELNNNAAAATDLGTLSGSYSPEWPVSLTTSVDFDYFRFSTSGPAELDVTIDPVGGRYLLDGVMVQTDEVIDLAFRVLGGLNGADILIDVNDTGLGLNETVVDFPLPAAGDYWLLVYRAAGTHDVQRYDFTLDVTPTDILAAGDGFTPPQDLGLSLYPNPFNPRTTARFYVAVPGPIAVDVYDVAGRLVRRLRDRAESVGWTSLAWDGRDDAGASAPSGAYLMQVRAGNRLQSIRGLLLE
ncbi:MAG TPA: matrixin family metalloprotease [Candidatus Krumholzibacteria bacterium]|nr:matrixin family metalloprotease [Candidatus Krumholzibacteria bacterium]HPD72568.1 matrixin family metalloprotease [Candidatus Krumholzibacteria bacterium]HRY40500.1 matrixin family metalloprotease [Candidatus Krumholzibacteria bacterium]